MAAVLVKSMFKKAGKVGLALIVLNEIRGVAVVATVLWGWLQTTP